MNRLQAELDVSLHLDLVGQMITDNFWGGFPHAHTFDEIIYVLKGPITVKNNCGNREVNRGEFALVPKGLEHCVTSPEPASFMYVGFHTNMVCPETQGVTCFSKTVNETWAKLAITLETVSQKSQRDREPLECFSGDIMMCLLPALLAVNSKEKELAEEPKVIISNKIKKYIETHLDQPIRVDEIAAGLYHSPHYIGNVFSAVNGITIKEYTLRYKMNKAIVLLGQEGLSVGAVAMRLGYDSPHYFSKCFKEYFGFSPSKYPGKLEDK